MSPDPQFDAFISYSSKDSERAQRLWDSLHKRGVKVWLDKDQIRPGDKFPKALSQGLASSRSMILIVTHESISSKYVGDECEHALQLINKGDFRFIPLIFDTDDTEWRGSAGLLGNRQSIDFSNESLYEQKVDQLIWPGITGQRVIFYPLSYCQFGHESKDQRDTPDVIAWERLLIVGEKLGLEFGVPDAGRVYRMTESINYYISQNYRVIVVVNVFDRTKYWGIDEPYQKTYINLIFKLREQTKDSKLKVIFLLYHHSQSWKKVELGVDIDFHEKINKLHTFFTINSDVKSDIELKSNLAEVWRGQIQPELLASWR